jgi:hypothetical protein
VNWDADPQDQAIVQIMIVLYIFMDGGIRPATAREMEDIASKGNVPPGRVRFALREATEAKMVQLHDGDLGPSYSITAMGVRWMEDNFSFSRKPRLSFVAKHSRISLKNNKDIDTMIRSMDERSQIDWTKWGAIFGGIGIIIAIIAIVV